MQSDFDFLTGRKNLYLKKYQDYLIHEDVIAPFKLLQESAKKEIGADLKIISSFRDFERQKLIWNDKAQGKRNIYNDDGEVIDPTSLNPNELIAKIMRFSAIPGASRHHWGTDFDIYDERKLSADKVQLSPQECAKDGVFCELHEWLDEKIKTGNAFGFFRPYDQDLGGVSQEKWHISYKPLSQEIFQAYTLEIFKENLEKSELALKQELLDQSESLFQQFITNITHLD